jgi:small subunit ribosomal protein S6e
MKFNICYPLTGGQKTFEIDDDKKCSIFFDRRMGHEVEGDQLGDEFKGYVFKIMGGNDKQGFPMRQGVLVKGRVRILMRKGQKGYRPRKTGEQKRKSIRGCIVGPDIRVLALSIVKRGDADLQGLTDSNFPRRLGPKRLSRLRKLYGFKKTDGVALVKKNMIRRTFTTKDGKKRQKAAKIQRLVTDARLRRRKLVQKARDASRLKKKNEETAYKKLVAEIRKQRLSRKKSSEV